MGRPGLACWVSIGLGTKLAQTRMKSTKVQTLGTLDIGTVASSYLIILCYNTPLETTAETSLDA